MKNHILERQQYLRVPMEEVFAFFSEIRNLEWLTPPWLGFQIVTSEKVEMKAGAQIDFVIRLAGLPVRWRTRITEWKPGVRFIDEQERGPYALWRHEHRFEPVDGGVLMTDRVCYRLPLGLLGRALHGLLVRWSVTAIFEYRFDRIREFFDGSRDENQGQRAGGSAAE
jgi:ligand-binding SRPBCC domain-containing protein